MVSSMMVKRRAGSSGSGGGGGSSTTGWTLVDADRLTRTAGNLVIASNSNTWAEVSSALRITLQGAEVGDLVKYGIGTWAVADVSSDNALQAGTIVSNAIVNRFVASTRSGPIVYVDSTVPKPATGQCQYILQSGDISGGDVVASLIASTGGSLTIRADGTYSMQAWAELWRPPAA